MLIVFEGLLYVRHCAGILYIVLLLIFQKEDTKVHGV